MYERSHSGYYNIWLLQFIVSVHTCTYVHAIYDCVITTMDILLALRASYKCPGHFAGSEGQL